MTASVHLDSAHLDVRVKPPLRIPFASVKKVVVDGEQLVLALQDGALVLHLGARAAATWAQKISHPRSRLQKLGIKPSQRVCLIGLDDAELERELSAAKVPLTRKLGKDFDVILLLALESDGLGKLDAACNALVPAGAIWVVREKGKSTKVSEELVRARAKQAGLVDVKVLAFSETRSALKLVIPVAKR
jgi:hypothetical protein